MDEDLKPDRWPTYPEWDGLINMIGAFVREGRLQGTDARAAKALVSAWNAGTIRFEKPADIKE